jgi:ATP-dependent Lhr-like helicase
VEAAGWGTFAAELVQARRAAWDGDALVAAERVALARAAAAGDEEALRTVTGGWLECVGPTTVPALAARTGLPPGRVAIGLAALEAQGTALRARFTPGATEEEWCERRLLARIHRLTLGILRREIEPTQPADLMRFLFRWQHLQPGTQLHGRAGLLEVIGQLQGVELPARAWETQVLAARIEDYDPDDLGGLCLSGAVAWGRLRADEPAEEDVGPRRARAPTRAAPLAFALREDLPWLLAPLPADAARGLPSGARAVLAHLERHGASFLPDIARGTGLLPAGAEEALWTLVARGLVTGDGVAGLRMLLKPEREQRRVRLRAVRGGRARLLPAGRWALLRAGIEAVEPDPIRFARQMLRRYGVVVRELLARETRMPPWRALLGALRTLEARGEVRGGRFVAGLVGEQFALPEAVEALRAVRKRAAPEDETVVVAAADPLNLVGVLLPGARLAATAHEVVAFRGGVVAESGELGVVLSRLGRRASGRAER